MNLMSGIWKQLFTTLNNRFDGVEEAAAVATDVRLYGLQGHKGHKGLAASAAWEGLIWKQLFTTKNNRISLAG